MNTNHQLTKNPDKSFIIELTLKKKEIKKEYDHVLSHFQAEFEQKGFRKGKAPLDVVEKNISPQAVIEEVLNHLLPENYQKIIEENKLKPIIEPSIKIKNEKLSMDSDWELSIESAELPDITISPKLYQDIKKINEDKKVDDKDKLNKIIECIDKNITITLPQIILTHDTNRRLSELISQLQSANLTIDQYLKNKNIDMSQLRKETEIQIKKDWTLNLAINQIAIDNKIDVKKEESQKLFENNPQLKEDPNLVVFLLTQQKVLEYLKKL